MSKRSDPVNRRMPLYRRVILLSVSGLIPVGLITSLGNNPPQFSISAAVLVGIAYLAVQLAQVRLTLGRKVQLHYTASELPLLVGAILLGPFTHIAVRFFGTAAGTAWRRSRSGTNDPIVGPAFANATSGALEVAVFGAVLMAFDWRASLFGSAPISVLIAWIPYAAVWETLIALARKLQGDTLRESINWPRVARGVALSFATMIAGLIFTMSVTSETRLLTPLLLIGVLCILAPVKFVMRLLARAEAHRSLDQFFTLLQTTDTDNVAEALLLACDAAQSSTVELILLERSGHSLPYDVIHLVTAQGRRTLTVGELPVRFRSRFDAEVLSVYPNELPKDSIDTPPARTEIVCPLVANGAVIGLLVLNDQLDGADTVDQSDVEVALRLAQHLSLWVQQDRLMTSLRNEAFNDPLTGLLNRRGFTEQWTALRSEGHQRVVALMIDLDNFKEINTHAGHGGGDQVLIEAAERLRAALPPRTVIARFGGDEFAVLIPGIRDQVSQDAYEFGLVVRRALSNRFRVDGSLLTVGGSVGVALWPDHGDDLTAVLKAADAALYAAKNDPDVGVSSQALPSYGSDSSLKMNAHRLEAALSNGDIKVFYQPLIDMATCRVAGFEALVRWQDGDQLVPPDRFIPLAEKTGHIHALTNYVMKHSFAATRAWQQMTGRPLTISVNFSTLSIGNPSVLDALDIELLKSGLNAADVHVEVTESRILRDTLRSTVHLKAVKQKGVKISLDDFGTGASTHQWLAIMQPDEIKIDRSFIRTMDEKHGEGIIKTHVFMAELFDMSTVAEGIETVEQWNRLQQLGVKNGQGYLLARPMPQEQVQTWLLNDEPHLQSLLTLAESLPSVGNAHIPGF
jgi:diguanylate cyclase (GGDEF)-like protein